MSTAIAIRPSTEVLAPRTINELQVLGAALAGSGFFQDAKDAAQAMAKIMAGAELGFPPVASMNGIYIVKGRISLSANLMAAAIKRSGKYNFKIKTITADLCELEFFENGVSVGLSSFSKAEAQKAGTQNMDKFARNMLFARAMSNGAKWYCADIFAGAVYTPEEMGAQVDGEGEVINPMSLSVQPNHVTVEPEPAEESAARKGMISEIADYWVEVGNEVKDFDAYKKRAIDLKNDKQLKEFTIQWAKKYESWKLEQEAKREVEAESIDGDLVEETKNETFTA